jgi:hypothetical protein
MITSALSFIVEPLDPPKQVALATVPVIDGRPLTDLVEEFEREHGFDPAGGYGGLVFEFFDFGPIEQHFRKSGDVYVLGCDCGEVGCWPLMCQIKADGDTITWAKFSQPHRPERDYSNFGPFIFDSVQHSDAISSLQASISRAR